MRWVEVLTISSTIPRAVSANDANQPVARHFNSGSHCISDMKIRALCPISGSNDSRKRQEMRLISRLGTVHPPWY